MYDVQVLLEIEKKPYWLQWRVSIENRSEAWKPEQELVVEGFEFLVKKLLI